MPPKRRESGPTVGEYFFYAWANRLIAPKSKRALEDWYRKTAIMQLRPVDLSLLTSQHYWEKWDRVTEADVKKIGLAFFQKVWAQQAHSPECVLFDTTNYYTYMASHTKSELAQRGHNKAGKHHLRQVGVGLLVDRVSHLPLYYREYQGNNHDSKLFQQVIDEMFGVLCGFNQTKQRLTVVFDKGMNSRENIASIDSQTRINFVTNYSPYFAEELAETDLKHFLPLEIERNRQCDEENRSADKLLAFRTKAEFWGKERSVVVTYNPITARKKNYTFNQKLDTLRNNLLEFCKLYRESRPQWRDAEKIKQRYERLCERLHIGSQYYQLTFSSTESKPTMSFSEDSCQVIKTKQLHGRNVIITDNQDWSTEDIVQLSLDRYVVEQEFRESKSSHHVNVSPFFHWTDSKIRCQLLVCVIALTALRLFENMLEKNGIQTRLGDHSGATILEEMRSLNSVLFWAKGKSKPEFRVQDPTPLQEKTFAALGYHFYDGSVLQNN